MKKLFLFLVFGLLRVHGECADLSIEGRVAFYPYLFTCTRCVSGGVGRV